MKKDINILNELRRYRLLMNYNTSKTFTDNLNILNEQDPAEGQLYTGDNNNQGKLYCSKIDQETTQRVKDIFKKIERAAKGHLRMVGTLESDFVKAIEMLSSKEEVAQLDKYVYCKTEFSGLKTFIWYEFSEEHDWNIKCKRKMDAWLNKLGVNFNLCYNCRLSTEKGPDVLAPGSAEYDTYGMFKRIRNFKPQYGRKKYPYPYSTNQPEAPNHPKVDIPYTGNLKTDAELWKERMRKNYNDQYPAEYFGEDEESWTMKFGYRQNYDTKVYQTRTHEIQKAFYDGTPIPPWGEFVEGKVYVDPPPNWWEFEDEKVDREEQRINAEKQRNFNVYPNYCGKNGKYSDVALPIPENPKGAEGEDAAIRAHCFYQGPNKKGIWVSSQSEIKFMSMYTGYTMQKNVNSIMTKYKVPEDKRSIVEEQWNKVFPTGCVMEFSDEDLLTTRAATNKAHYRFNTKTYEISFLGYYLYTTDANNKPQVSDKPIELPGWVDERTSRQQFVDKWYNWINWAGLAVAAASIIFTRGGGTWIVAGEIMTELAINSVIGYRDFEKGDYFGAAMSFVFATIPMFKTLNWVQGLDEASLLRVSDSIKNSGLTAASTDIEWLRWLNTLGDTDKITFSKIFDDAFTRKKLLQRLERLKMDPRGAKETVNALTKLYGKKEYKTLFKDIKWTKQLWAKELAAYGGALFVEVCLELIFGDSLDPQVVQDLAGVFQNIPKEREKELGLNLVSNAEIVNSKPEVKKALNEVSKDQINKQYKDKAVREIKNFVAIKDSIINAGGNYEEIMAKEDEVNIEKAIKDGYVKCDEFKKEDCPGTTGTIETLIFGDVQYCKCIPLAP